MTRSPRGLSSSRPRPGTGRFNDMCPQSLTNPLVSAAMGRQRHDSDDNKMRQQQSTNTNNVEAEIPRIDWALIIVRLTLIFSVFILPVVLRVNMQWTPIGMVFLLYILLSKPRRR